MITHTNQKHFRKGGRPVDNKKDNIPGWVIFLSFVTGLWPFGIAMMFMNWLGIPAELKKSFQQGAKQSRQARSGYYQYQQTPPMTGAAQGPVYTGQNRPGAQAAPQQAQAQVPPKAARKTVQKARIKIKKKAQALAATLTGGGAALSFIMLIALVDEWSSYGFSFVGDWFPLVGFLCGGLYMLGTGIGMSRKQKRLRLYMGVIGTRNSVFLADLASAAGVSQKKVIDDLQDFLADGTLPMGYIDRASGRLVFTDQGYEHVPTAAQPQKEVKKDPEAEKKEQAKQEDKDNDILRQIKLVNDAIPDPEMTRKIDRIGEITGKILDYQRRNPGKSGELRQFLNYYLPTTLKILQAYAQLEAQGVEGENISAAKERIEGMMDKVVEGFEKQLDQLFKADAMDIATDVEVLERMLDKDGLGTGMTMGG